MLDNDARARAAQIAAAIQTSVSARPDIAVSPMGMGLDALSGLLVSSPDAIVDFGPMLTMAVGAYNYVLTGERSEALDAMLAGTFTW